MLREINLYIPLPLLSSIFPLCSEFLVVMLIFKVADEILITGLNMIVHKSIQEHREIFVLGISVHTNKSFDFNRVKIM